MKTVYSTGLPALPTAYSLLPTTRCPLPTLMSTHWIADRTKSFDSSGIRKVFDLGAKLANPIKIGAQKYSTFAFTEMDVHCARSAPSEGRTRRHETWSGMRWTGMAVRRAVHSPDGEIAWSCRPDAGDKSKRS